MDEDKKSGHETIWNLDRNDKEEDKPKQDSENEK